MDLNIIEHIAAKIKEADMVLVGVGEELDQIRKMKKNDIYIQLSNQIEEKWLLPFWNNILIDELKEEGKSVYKSLLKILNGKNYFLVTTCQDGLAGLAGFDSGRIVEPCGGYSMLQCSEGCSTELYSVPEQLSSQIRDFIDGRKIERNFQPYVFGPVPNWKELPNREKPKRERHGYKSEKELLPPTCPNCGRPLVFNNVEAKQYNEEGYLANWMIYKKWLQGTINKNLCILEIGVGMDYPSVIRWPFEKITYYNQKSELFRIHSRLYQMSEEIKDRGYGICQKPEDFIWELSNAF